MHFDPLTFGGMIIASMEPSSDLRSDSGGWHWALSLRSKAFTGNPFFVKKSVTLMKNKTVRIPIELFLHVYLPLAQNSCETIL